MSPLRRGRYDADVPRDLVQYQHMGDLHFVTFSCYERRPYLDPVAARHLFERALETMRLRYDFFVSGYVVMREHVHLLVSELRLEVLGTALQALKLCVSVRQTERPFWQRRYHDFNAFLEEKQVEKLRYLHRNPVARGWSVRPRPGQLRVFGAGRVGDWGG